MINASALPERKDKTFNMDYYCNKRLPLVPGWLAIKVKSSSAENRQETGNIT
jgi:hypothetical protein